jgi:hypothetical protein
MECSKIDFVGMENTLPSSQHQYFALGRSMNAQENARMKDTMANPTAIVGHDASLSRLAAAIGDPSRARMLCSLLDGHARTSTELAIVAEVSPSTASAHLSRLRYYSLEGAEVAAALESLLVLAGASRPKFAPTTPEPLRHARTCYDHMAGTIAVAIHLRFTQLHWIMPQQKQDGRSSEDALDLTPPAPMPLSLWESTSKQPAPCAAASPTVVLTGANASPTSVARSVPLFCKWHGSASGSSANTTAAPCTSRGSANANFRAVWESSSEFLPNHPGRWKSRRIEEC